jgi:signal transduction histidine kinase
MTELQAQSPGPSGREHIVDDTFAALAQATSDLVAIVTAEGRVLFLNRAGRHRIGLATTARMASVPLCAYVQEEDHVLTSRLIADVATKGAPHECDIRFRHQQTQAPIRISCQLWRLDRPAPSGSLAVAIVGSEVDGHPAVPSQEANGLTRLTEMFAGIVGHDLRNPLNAILTCAHLVIHQCTDPELKTALGRIVTSGHRMQRMIDQLLDLTRIRLGSGIPLHVTPVDLAAVAQQAVQEVSAAYPDREIRLQVSGDVACHCDADRVAQMISNLLGNAAQHGTPGVEIRLVVAGSEGAQVTLALHNGGAIPPELMPVLFNPFRIVNQKRQKSMGLGLGLYVTRQIARAHGGDVQVTSSDAAGTSFIVRLPREPVAADSPAALAGLGEEDMAVLELLATAPPATSVTAQLFGAVALHERAPREYWRLFERYLRLLDLALDHQTYRATGAGLSTELRDVAEQLGALGAGAREVAELHARALKQKTRGVTLSKAQAVTAEGRLVSFELMGHLLSFYRRRSGLA